MAGPDLIVIAGPGLNLMAGFDLIVMAGLGPAIHVFVATARKDVDGLATASTTDATAEVVKEILTITQ